MRWYPPRRQLVGGPPRNVANSLRLYNIDFLGEPATAKGQPGGGGGGGSGGGGGGPWGRN